MNSNRPQSACLLHNKQELRGHNVLDFSSTDNLAGPAHKGGPPAADLVPVPRHRARFFGLEYRVPVVVQRHTDLSDTLRNTVDVLQPTASTEKSDTR